MPSEDQTERAGYRPLVIYNAVTKHGDPRRALRVYARHGRAVAPPEVCRVARQRLRDQVPHAQVMAASAVLGELTANAIRHAPGPLAIHLDVAAGRSPAVHVAVYDTERAMPPLRRGSVGRRSGLGRVAARAHLHCCPLPPGRRWHKCVFAVVPPTPVQEVAADGSDT